MIKLMKSSFYHEAETKQKLINFIEGAAILSMSEQCAMFESAFAKKQGRQFAVFVTNGSLANLILIQSLLNLGQLKRGQKVGVSALTWVTNITPLIQLGLTPVALDCELDTLNVSPAILEKKIAELDALFLTNVLGFSDDISQIKALCQKYNVLFIEDNCESLGSKVNGTLLGNFGLASTFSFFVGHHMSTIEGGMIVTDDPELHDMLVVARAHGWDRNLSKSSQQKLRTKHHVSDFYARYTFYDLAINGRPSEINGFIGNTQIGFWDEIVTKRQQHFALFQQAVGKNDQLYPIRTDHMDVVSNFAVPVVAKNSELFNTLRAKFEKADVEIRPVIAGDMTKQPFYRKYVGGDESHQNAALIHQNGFYFPNHPELTTDEVDLLCSLVA